MDIENRQHQGGDLINHYNLDVRGYSDTLECDAIDAITDILHLCAAENIDPLRVLKMSTNHIKSELNI